MVYPDAAKSSSVSIKRESTDAHDDAPSISQHMTSVHKEDTDDPIVREIDVYISPELANTLHLLQFPIQPASSPKNSKHHKPLRQPEPITAKFRPKHHMLELQYSIPNHAKGVPDRLLADTMCLTSRTFTSSHIAPVTHMALAKLSNDGSRLDVVPMQTSILQMRPSFHHLHTHDDVEDDDKSEEINTAGRQKPIIFQKKENIERSASQRRNSYAYKRASEESEDWISLDIHGNTHNGGWTPVKKEYMERVKCMNRGKTLKLSLGMGSNEGYVRSLNYLDSIAGSAGSIALSANNDLSDWKPSSCMDEQVESSPVSESEKAAAELAAKLVMLLQNGNGSMIPYRVIRSRLSNKAISDNVLTMALSSCAVLVRGNFCLKSSLARFVNTVGSSNARGKAIRELRDLILLLLNMHGIVQRERLSMIYSQQNIEFTVINPDIITALLETVAKRSNDSNCWVPKVKDDEQFAVTFPNVAAFHGVYWMKKKSKMIKLVQLYESASDKMEESQLEDD